MKITLYFIFAFLSAVIAQMSEQSCTQYCLFSPQLAPIGCGSAKKPDWTCICTDIESVGFITSCISSCFPEEQNETTQLFDDLCQRYESKAPILTSTATVVLDTAPTIPQTMAPSRIQGSTFELFTPASNAFFSGRATTTQGFFDQPVATSAQYTTAGSEPTPPSALGPQDIPISDAAYADIAFGLFVLAILCALGVLLVV